MQAGVVRAARISLLRSSRRRTAISRRWRRSAACSHARECHFRSPQSDTPGNLPGHVARTGLADRRKLPPTARAWPLPCTGEALPAGK